MNKKLYTKVEKLLKCPRTGEKLSYDDSNQCFCVENNGIIYPIIEGIVELLPEEFDENTDSYAPWADYYEKYMANPTIAMKSQQEQIWGIKHDEVPLVQFSLVIDGGHLLEDLDKAGTASLMANIMNEGTANKTPEELEEEIDLLGSSIYISGGSESISINGNTLARNFEKTIELLKEMLLEPRWDEEEFELAKESTINSFPRILS